MDVHRNIDICEEDQIEVSIEEAIDGNIGQIDKERVKALTRQKSKNTQFKMNHPQTLLPKKTTSPEMKKRGNRFANDNAGKKVSQYGNNDLNSHDETAMVDHLRVSSVKEVVEDQKYVEITMANQSDDDGSSDNQSDFYKPIGISPMKTRNKELKSDAKCFSQLQSHRQETRKSFSPPFRGLKAEAIAAETTD